MVRLYGDNYTHRQLSRRVGDLSQVGGLRPFTFTEGPARGMSGVDVRSGSGFNYTVLIDRGLDLSVAEYRGIPIAWRSCVGDRSPAFFEPEGLRWLRTFGGGLLVTCGLDTTGVPSEDQGQEFGLHGRYTSLPAERVRWDEQWKGNSCTLTVEGRMRQASVFGENLLLHRRLETPLGESRVILHDRVENAGSEAQPHLILYHWNFGFPLVDEGTRLFAPVQAIVPRDDEAARGLKRAMVMEAPARRAEQCYFYTLGSRGGWTEVALVNSRLNAGAGLGVLLRYRAETLPHFVQWKCMAEGTYVCGLEPSNSELLGRAEARRQGKLPTLRPGASVEYEIELQVLDGKKAISEAVRRITPVGKV